MTTSQVREAVAAAVAAATAVGITDPDDPRVAGVAEALAAELDGETREQLARVGLQTEIEEAMNQ